MINSKKMYIDTLNKFTDSKNQLVKELFWYIEPT